MADEAQAQEIEQAGGIAYTPEEVRTLLTESAGVDEAILKDYLNKMHMVKKMFPGSKIQN